MTESPVHVRAVARVGDQPGTTGSATLLPRRRPGHLGPVHVIQLLLAEIVIIAMLAAAGGGPVALAVTGVLGLAMLAVTLSRREGRWWLERQMMTWQYQYRQQMSSSRDEVVRPAELIARKRSD